MSEQETCDGERRSRASWMGEFQSESCPCVLPKDHDGPHACDHDRPCTSTLLLRWGSAACDNQEPNHALHSQSASGLTWTDAEAKQSIKDREDL